MVERIIMDKSVNLGFEEKEGDLIGRRWGYDIHRVKNGASMAVDVFDRKKFKKVYGGDIHYRKAASLALSKRNGAWHVDMVEVDSRYKGRRLATKLYGFLLKTLDITLMAGSSQSIGGRYIWNSLAKDRNITIYAKKGPYSTVVDFPKPGKRELVGKSFNLYGCKAAIFAVAA